MSSACTTLHTIIVYLVCVLCAHTPAPAGVYLCTGGYSVISTNHAEATLDVISLRSELRALFCVQRLAIFHNCHQIEPDFGAGISIGRRRRIRREQMA